MLFLFTDLRYRQHTTAQHFSGPLLSFLSLFLLSLSLKKIAFQYDTVLLAIGSMGAG